MIPCKLLKPQSFLLNNSVEKKQLSVLKLILQAMESATMKMFPFGLQLGISNHIEMKSILKSQVLLLDTMELDQETFLMFSAHLV